MSESSDPPPLKPRRAMVLAAGLGLRMRPVTDTMPKPLVPVAGKTLLDRILDNLAAYGIRTAVVNTHYRAEMIERHLAGRRAPRIVLSHERELLDTGGAVVRALEAFNRKPFFVINGDTLWLDGYRPALERMASAWDDEAMDALLLVHPAAAAFGYDGRGDYFLDSLGHLRRRRPEEVAPFAFAGLQLVHRRLFKRAPAGPFSMNLLWDQAQEAGRLFGVVNDGVWFHVGTPDDLALAEAHLQYLQMGP